MGLIRGVALIISGETVRYEGGGWLLGAGGSEG